MSIPSGGTSTVDSGAYTDLNRLASLKHGDRESEANLKKVAQEFESLFVSQMLKAMRSANEVLAKDNPLNSDATRQYQDMYDQQLSVSLSREGGGIGLQDVLMRQLSKTKTTDVAPAPQSAATPGSDPAVQPQGLATRIAQRPLWASRSVAPAATADGTPHNDVAALNARRLALPSKLADRIMAGIVPNTAATQDTAASGATTLKNRIAVSTAVAAAKRAGTNGDWTIGPGYTAQADAYVRNRVQTPLAPAKSAFASADDFVNTMLPLAQDAAARIGVDPTVLVAQAALETGWGKSIMRQSDGSSSHNLFGIKAQGGWQGPEARAITSEFRDGKMVKETADFRSYQSYADSFHDLVSFLQNNNRYQATLKSADNPEQFVKELQKAGYATDPDYASKISQIAKQMKSYQSYAAAPVSSTTL
ncbi:flagellar assembly peptidoglycan hydrolase FlgJ [Pseudomonas sp. GD03842]|uniref:flagellar assembly peptidoglycan hydrolase FlgJ n=1 Tax=unclassified Pseudomonas TaxID=196821 RepID=UPI000D37A57B|nr:MULTISPECIES: flagellar assembly peptidoglycan hydrolase FlgJ [unclassified Pseudomonas]MDH0749141.1 flagellar assembly peptidoglycan hydrolase FlgJ [Pseudomonas sp. GD03842]RAU39798.1 peptidoglycan hydrolase FlgJ [Pseudomonas sp. RIT 409]RAU46004.1 peptidoglycan hydrolase FlgJ [Pseudomonas sp. RIT 412]